MRHNGHKDSMLRGLRTVIYVILAIAAAILVFDILIKIAGILLSVIVTAVFVLAILGIFLLFMIILS
jgi:hypothetical protein